MSTKRNDESLVDDMIEELDSRSEKEQRVLTQLLDKAVDKRGSAFALRTEMGRTLNDNGKGVRVPVFVTAQSLSWVGSNVKMGSEMPFMSGHINEKGVLEVDASIAETVSQRSPDYTRQPAITAYLAHDSLRKFPTLVAVLNPPWVDDPDHENWGPDGRALKSSYSYRALDTEGRIGLVNLDDTIVYALDGQHRVMGIRGIQEIQDTGFLLYKNRDGAAKSGSSRITKDDFLKHFELTIGQLQSLLSETLSIELIPAVLAGETRAQASRRIRSVFITVNSYSQRPGKSEATLLEESNGFAIVARKGGTLHPLFKEDRVNWKNSTLPQRTRWYTTLETLKDMASEYLPSVDAELTRNWVPMFNKQVPVRPSEQHIETGRALFFELLDAMQKLPVFKGLASGDDLDEVRLFPDADHPDRQGHLLLRPIGQIILAKALGTLAAQGVTLPQAIKKLKALDEDGRFRQHDPSTLWYGVTFDIAGQKINTRAPKDLSARLLHYLVKGADSETRKDLLSKIIEARREGKPEDHTWRNFEGKLVKYDPNAMTRGVQLPEPAK